MHQSVVALAIPFSLDGKFLLQLRNDPRNQLAHRHWEYPGGGIQFGETPKMAALRELHEELHAKGEILPNFVEVTSSMWKNKVPYRQIILIAYLVKLHDFYIVDVPKNDEVLEAQWLSPKEILSLPLLPEVDHITTAAERFLHEYDIWS